MSKIATIVNHTPIIITKPLSLRSEDALEMVEITHYGPNAPFGKPPAPEPTPSLEDRKVSWVRKNWKRLALGTLATAVALGTTYYLYASGEEAENEKHPQMPCQPRCELPDPFEITELPASDGGQSEDWAAINTMTMVDSVKLVQQVVETARHCTDAPTCVSSIIHSLLHHPLAEGARPIWEYSWSEIWDHATGSSLVNHATQFARDAAEGLGDFIAVNPVTQGGRTIVTDAVQNELRTHSTNPWTLDGILNPIARTVTEYTSVVTRSFRNG